MAVGAHPGKSVARVAQQMGNKPSMTADTYAHVFDDLGDERASPENLIYAARDGEAVLGEDAEREVAADSEDAEPAQEAEAPEDALELAAAEDEQPVEALPPDAADPALEVRVRVRCPERSPDDPDPLALENSIEGAAELRVPIVDQKPWPLAAIVEVHQQVARLLHHPGAVGVARAGHVLDPAAAGADEDEHVQPAQQDGVNGEEVAGERRRGVLAQERAPVRLATLGCRWNTGCPEHVAHQCGGDVDPELAQLADDPEVAPAVVLARQSQDQLAHLLA